MERDPRQSPLRRAAEIQRTRGTGELATRVAAKLGGSVFKTNCAVWYGKALSPSRSPAGGARPSATSGAASRPGARAEGEFAVVDPVELAAWLRANEGLAWAADERELGVAVGYGHRWTRWTVAGRTAAFCKAGGGGVFVVDFDRTVELPPGVAYISDIYVMSEMRRKGIGSALLDETLNFLRECSFHGVACHIPRSNTASSRLFASQGFAPLGAVRFTRVLGVPLFSTRPEILLELMPSECG